MRVQRTTYLGWPDYPVYHVYNYKDYCVVAEWMRQNECDEFLLGSGPDGYTFQVKQNHEWFALRWA